MTSQKTEEMLEIDVALVIEQLASKIGYRFNGNELPIEALTHKSHFNEHPRDTGFNERLEFLGDAVLDLIVAEVLMKMMPLSREGELTQSRAAMVNEESLAFIARDLDLGDMIMLGQGEEKNNGRNKPSILSDAVEALVGAIFLEGGFQVAKEVVLPWFASMLNQIMGGESVTDPKSALQEQLQANKRGTPVYRLAEATGPDHNKSFVVDILLRGEKMASGEGRSKKEAEKQAARNALENLNGEEQ